MVFMRIAIVKISALGDIVHSMVVLQFIKKYNPEILIDWIVEENYKELLENHPHINQIHTVNLRRAKNSKSIFQLFYELKKMRNLQSYDLLIDMQGLLKSAVIAKIIPSKLTIGFDKKSSREPIASFFYNKKFNIGYEENVVKRNFELVNFALGLPYDFESLDRKLPFLFSTHGYENLNLSCFKKNVVIIPGASNSSKQYPVKKIAELTQRLDINFIIIWGNEYEKKLANEISGLSPKVKISDKMSIDGLVSLVSRADLVIGGDTGPTHLAWALNIPSIALFGSTPGYRNSMVSNINKIIESKSDVNPLKIDKEDFSIQEISVDEVLHFAQSLLSI